MTQLAQKTLNQVAASIKPSLSPVNIALVGLNFGSGIARHLANHVPNLHVQGVCDQNICKSGELGRELSVTVYETLDDVLRDDSVEAVGLFTGPHGRAGLISKIIESGRHLLTTKPFELDIIEAERVLIEAERRGLVIHLNSPAPTPSEDITLIRQWAEQAKLGRPVSFHAQTWAHYREQANGTWYDDPQLCPAAPILRLGIYFLNDFAPLLGNPRRLFASESRLFTKKPTSDHAQVSIEFENGSLGTIFASFCVGDGQPYRDQIMIQYENGTIRRWMERHHLPDMSNDSAVVELTTGGRVRRTTTAPGNYAGWYQWDAFVNAVRNREVNTPENRSMILRGLHLMDAIRRSLNTGMPVTVNSG